MVKILKHLTREALESEVMRLRQALETSAGQTLVSGAQRNIAAQLAASRAALAASEARQRAILECAIDFAMVATDPRGNITEWNAGAVNVMGWSAEEVLGQSAAIFFTPTDRATGRVELEMQRALLEGRASDERWHLRKDGQLFWASGELMPLYADDQSHLGFVKILRDRTQEHLAGRALFESQERYRLALKATRDAVWDWDLQTRQIVWNEALQQAYGFPCAAIDSTSEWRFAQIHPQDRERVEESIRSAIDGSGSTWSAEYRFRCQDGSYAEVLDRGHLIRDADGRAERIIGAMLDLTRSRSAETALRLSEERFSTILETIEAAFAIVKVKFDADDRPVDYYFVEANPAFERQCGVNLRGKWVTEFAPNLEKFWFETYGHVAKTGEPANFESYANTFERWFDVRAVRVGDPADRQIAILFNDVTERRDAEERLRVSEAFARENVERVQLALAAGAIIGTWHWDLPTDSFTVDEAFAKVFNLDPALGRTGLSLEQVVTTVHPDDRDGLIRAINEAIARGGAYSHQYRVRDADGKYNWLEANGRVECADDVTALRFPGVLIDVEERRSVEAERDRANAALRALNDTLEQRVIARAADLMQAEEKLRQSQKMEAVGQLTGGLAHDFNNLLAGISAALELMQKRIAQDRFKDVDKYLATAQGATKRAAALTHRLLAFSRRQTLDPRPTDVNTLIVGMTELIQRTVGPSIRLKTLVAPDLWPALVDASQLENALLNLCINARDAMPDGGGITVETANRAVAVESVRTLDTPEGEYLCLCVTDTGTGMSTEVIAKAFDPFFTTKPLGQGTGLGLSMTYGFTKQSGGHVRVHSQVGQGTTMCIYLPRYRGEAKQNHDATRSTTTPLVKAGETILIVDDEPTVRILLKDVLSELGYTVLDATDSIEGLETLRSNTQIDLLITDVGLPGGMNGRQMADAGREIRPKLKTLFITGYAENAVIGSAQLGPGMQVLTKPFAVDTLVSRVSDLLYEAKMP